MTGGCRNDGRRAQSLERRFPESRCDGRRDERDRVGASVGVSPLRCDHPRAEDKDGERNAERFQLAFSVDQPTFHLLSSVLPSLHSPSFSTIALNPAAYSKVAVACEIGCNAFLSLQRPPSSPYDRRDDRGSLLATPSNPAEPTPVQFLSSQRTIDPLLQRLVMIRIRSRHERLVRDRKLSKKAQPRQRQLAPIDFDPPA